MSYIRIARRAFFSSAVRMASPLLTREENIALYGSLYSDHGHGHNFILEAHLAGPIDDKTGMLLPMAEVDQVLKKVTEKLDHRHLNHDLKEFSDVVPTTENIAIFCYDLLLGEFKKMNQSILLEKVRLYENEEFWVDFGLSVTPEIL